MNNLILKMIAIPDLDNIALFVTAASILIIIPGPAVLYIMSKSIEQGYKAGFVSVLGIGIGGLAHVFGAAFGISAILLASATAFSIIKFLGGFYLIFLGIKKILGKQDFDKKITFGKTKKLSQIFYEGILVNMFNPKAAIFFFAFLPQFINIEKGAVTSQIVFLGILFIFIAVCSDSLYVLISGRLASWLKSRSIYTRIHKYLMGSIYISLGLITLTVSRPMHSVFTKR